LDGPGHERARFERRGLGFGLSGLVELEDDGVVTQLRYTIECDEFWCTRAVVVDGERDDKPFYFAIEGDGKGHFGRRGVLLPEFDVDLGFTPATNTLPIRRLDLGVGQKARLHSTWLRFPELHLERLEQVYVREGAHSYLYQAWVDGEPFSARLETDELGRVVLYEGQWAAATDF
jgi:hypothetical protein